MAKTTNDKATTSAENLESSGKTQFTQSEGRQTLKIPKSAVGPEVGGAALQTFFTRISPDAAPGWNTLTITGLATNTRVITVWMTEWVLGNQSHAGGAWYTTVSVQLFDQGRQCRVRYYLEWNSHLPTACMAIYGPA